MNTALIPFINLLVMRGIGFKYDVIDEDTEIIMFNSGTLFKEMYDEDKEFEYEYQLRTYIDEASSFVINRDGDTIQYGYHDDRPKFEGKVDDINIDELLSYMMSLNIENMINTLKHTVK